ncbi:hypothetical protein D3C71_1607350 [compost metagenome]
MAVDQVGHRLGHRVRVAQIHRAVVDARQQGGDVLLAGQRHGLLQAGAQDLAEALGVVRGQRQRADLEVLRQQTVAQQAQQGGEQIALGQVAGGAEQEEGVVHRSSFRSG